MSILNKLAQGFEINYDCVVKHVEIVKGQRGHPAVRVVNTRGTEWTADKVCINRRVIKLHVSRCILYRALCIVNLGDSDCPSGCVEVQHGDL